MNKIESRDNKTLKNAVKLLSKKGRDREGSFLVEGDKLAAESLDMGKGLEALFVESSKVNRYGNLIERAEAAGAGVYEVSDSIFSRLASVEHGDGVVAVFEMPGLSPSGFSEMVGDGDNILILDRLQDPGNLGTLVRTAEASGYSGVIAVKGTADFFSPKVVRAAAGSLFRVPIIYLDEDEAARMAKDLGKKLAVTVPSGGTNYRDAGLSRDIALVIGNEGRGVSEKMMENADVKVTIPMKGKLESLNASVSAALMMYEAVK